MSLTENQEYDIDAIDGFENYDGDTPIREVHLKKGKLNRSLVCNNDSNLSALETPDPFKIWWAFLVIFVIATVIFISFALYTNLNQDNSQLLANLFHVPP